MSEFVVEQQEHGYLKGHQLLSSSIKLPREDQDLVDRLSDISGQLRPDETFAPYLTGYPLPSRTHYVLARTWQDLEVARAGCVLTRSLLVPATVWMVLPSIQPLLKLLTPIARGRKAHTLNFAEHQEAAPAPVHEPYTVELTEALFLETRVPTVVMDVSRAEAAAVRILTAIWPRLRRHFAVCTYALGPRKLGGRDFDLLFAPKSARMRFAEWQGRRIEASKPTPRHRWSASTAQQIFEAPDPRLSAIDSLGMLDSQGDGEDGNLRLVLLWKELSAKARETPSAVLGLLDIANSQGERGEKARVGLIPAAATALNMSRDTASHAETWRFTNTLLGKFSGEAPTLLGEAAEVTARSLAQEDPIQALQFLQSEASADRDVPVAILSGAADGLSAARGLDTLVASFDALEPNQLLRMIAVSPSLAETIIALAKRDPSGWVELVARSLREAEGALAAAGADRLLPATNDDSLAPIVSAMLVDADPTRFGEVVRAIGQSTNFEQPKLANLLLSEADTPSRRGCFREAVANASKGTTADFLLLNTLKLDGESLDWLATTRLAPDRVVRLALAVLAARSDREIASFVSAAPNQTSLLEILARDLPASAAALGRVVMLSRLPLQDALIWFDNIQTLISPEMRDWMASGLLERALVDGTPNSERLRELLNVAGVHMDGAQLIRHALANGTPAARWAANLVALNTAPSPIRAKIVEHIDFMSERLVRGISQNLGPEAYEAWAMLLRDSEKSYRSAHMAAAILSLDFALGHARYPVGSLAEVAFPPVHASLPSSRAPAVDSIFGVMVTISLAMFGEIDRAKSARRALVHAFMHSDWSPSRLVLAGLKAKVDQKLLKLVSKEYGGEAYLRSIDRDADQLPQNMRQRVRAALEKFDRSEKWRVED